MVESRNSKLIADGRAWRVYGRAQALEGLGLATPLHQGVFHGPGGINRTAWGTKLLLTALLASLVDSTSLCHILKV